MIADDDLYIIKHNDSTRFGVMGYGSLVAKNIQGESNHWVALKI